MKRVLGIILVMACAVFSGARWGYSACIEDKDLDLLIKEMKQKITGQEKTVESLNAKYSRIMKQKKELLDFIEQDKQKLKEKPAQQMIEKKKRGQVKSLVEQKERLCKAERERQINFALEKAKKILQAKDINCFDLLIKKQSELCAVIIQLEIKITSEEKNLKLLKESRKFLANPK